MAPTTAGPSPNFAYLTHHDPRLAEVATRAERVPLFGPRTQGLDFVDLEDEVDIEIEGFNKRVVTEGFNRVVCAELARHLDPTEKGKTLIFAATDSHADLVVTLLKQAFRERYGAEDDAAVVKITGTADRPLHKIRLYRNERLPSVVVTVNLLTTGIDVPASPTSSSCAG